MYSGMLDGSHIILELLWSYMKCQLLCHFPCTFTALANTFAGHSILSFLMKILEGEISQRNKEEKCPDSYWEGNYLSLDVKREFLWHPKVLIILCNQPEVKDLGLIHLVHMALESKAQSNSTVAF